MALSEPLGLCGGDRGDQNGREILGNSSEKPSDRIAGSKCYRRGKAPLGKVYGTPSDAMETAALEGIRNRA